MNREKTVVFLFVSNLEWKFSSITIEHYILNNGRIGTHPTIELMFWLYNNAHIAHNAHDNSITL